MTVQFEGGVVVISHDSQLLSVVCDDEERSEVWLVEDGKVQTYDGYFQVHLPILYKEASKNARKTQPISHEYHLVQFRP